MRLSLRLRYCEVLCCPSLMEMRVSKKATDSGEMSMLSLMVGWNMLMFSCSLLSDSSPRVQREEMAMNLVCSICLRPCEVKKSCSMLCMKYEM